jgi:hypothetical protein
VSTGSVWFTPAFGSFTTDRAPVAAPRENLHRSSTGFAAWGRPCPVVTEPEKKSGTAGRYQKALMPYMKVF